MATTIQTVEIPKKARALDTSSGWQPIGSNLNTESNPTSTGGNESNTVSGISWGTALIDLESSVVSDGSYSMKFTAVANGSRTYVDLSAAPYSLTVGKKYRISIDSRHTGSGDDYILQFNQTNGLNTGSYQTALQTITSSDTTFVTYTLDIVFDNDKYKYFGIKEEGDNNNASGYLDNFVILELENFPNNNHGQIYSGRGLEFDGVADYLTTGEVFQSTFRDSHTISFWVKPDDGQPAAYTSVLGARDGTGDDSRIYFNIQTTGKINFYYEIEGTTLQAETNLAVFNNGTNSWHRVVGVVNNTTNQIHIYVNGVDQTLDGTNDGDIGSTDLSNYTSTRPLFIGGASNDGVLANIYAGLISDVQIWDTAWTAADVTYDYLNPESLALNGGGTALTESNLKLWYPMQDGHRGQQSYILDGANSGLGDELVTNGGFDADSDWSKDANWEIANGKATSSGAGRMYQSISHLESNVGTVVKVTFDIVERTSGGVVVNCYGGGSSEFNTVGTHSFITTTTNTLNLYFNNSGTGNLVGSIDNISVKPINDKNHATTVFYGDTLWDTAASTNGNVDNWQVFLNNTVATDSGTVKGTYVDAASGIYIYLKDSKDLSSDLTVGRTYRLQYDIKVNTGSVSPAITVSGGTTVTGDAVTSTTFVTKTIDFTCEHTTGHYFWTGNMGAGEIVYLDNFSLKEVGVASGWTDADQQLHIPQTALQSYNELAWCTGTGGVAVGTLGADLGANDFVLSYVINTVVQAGDIRFLSLGGSGTPDAFIHKLGSDGKLRLYIKDSDSTIINFVEVATGGTIVTGETYHIVESFDRSAQEVSIYINGVLIKELDISALSATANISASGNLNFHSYVESLSGLMTEVALWKNTDFDSTEVLELYNDGKPLDALTHTKASTLYGYWRNNGLSTWVNLANPGTKDSTSNTLTETILIPQGVDSTRDNQGFIMNKQKDTSCLNLTNTAKGPRTYVDLGSTTTIADDAAASFIMWIKPDDFSDHRFLTDGTNDRWRFQSSTIIECYADSTDMNFTVSTMTAGEWIHVALVRAADDDWYVYTNGNASSSNPVSQNKTFDYRYIGGLGPNSDGVRGQIDGFLVYNKELSSTEILRNYNATKGSHRN